MSDFDNVSAVYDRGIRPLEWLIFDRLRRRIFPRLRGRVLELGAGTGVNLPLYGKDAWVVGLDTSGEMLSWAARRRPRASVSLVRADAHHLPFPSSVFDVVSGSLVFCSVAAPERGLAEAKRVLQSRGRLVLLEHTRGTGLGAWLTDMIQPLWGRMSSDCRLDRETVQAVAGAGFGALRVEDHALGIVRSIEAVAGD